MSRERPALWKCPRCGREFAKRNQWHSCAVHSVDDHFGGKDPQLRDTFDALVSRLEDLRPFRVDAVKTSINLIGKHHFGGVAVPRRALRLGFMLDETVGSARIARAQGLGPNRVGHSVKLYSPDDVDEELLGWLRKAHSLQS